MTSSELDGATLIQPPKAADGDPDGLTENQRAFLDLIARRETVVFDGAMGTGLFELGYLHTRAFDEANLTNPNKVLAVHEGHLRAGAQVIETNTFSANRLLLAKYGIPEKVRECNLEAVKLARQAIENAARGREVYVAGAIGPTGMGRGHLLAEQKDTIRDAFAEQVDALVEAGVDLIVLETFVHLKEIRICLEVVRSRFKGAIVAQMSFDDDPTKDELCGQLKDGSSPAVVAERLEKWGANVVGPNCGVGPQLTYEVAVEMVKATTLPVIVCPNAGSPHTLDGRSIYMCTPEYYGVFSKRAIKAGVRMIGGCCGVNASHIAQVVGAAKMGSAQGSVTTNTNGVMAISRAAQSRLKKTVSVETMEPAPLADRSKLGAKVARVWRDRLGNGRKRQAPKGPDDFVVSVEVNPPKGLDPSRNIDHVRYLKKSGVDVINIADGPRATVRMSNMAFGLKVKQECDTEVILHVCCRDRNLLGLQADILGYNVLGMNNMVIITGDPPKMGDYPNCTPVFDLDSIDLLQLVNDFNCGMDPVGNVTTQTNFFLATGAEPGAVDYRRELKRLEQKVAAGANLIMTQPVYDKDVVNRFLNDIEHLNVPVLLGLCPLVSYRNAEFLQNEVPGMSVPAPIRERMKVAGRGPAAIAEGVKIAKEMLNEFKDRVVGVYIMPQLGKYYTALQILEDVGYAGPAEVGMPTVRRSTSTSTSPSATPQQNGNTTATAGK